MAMVLAGPREAAVEGLLAGQNSRHHRRKLGSRRLHRHRLLLRIHHRILMSSHRLRRLNWRSHRRLVVAENMVLFFGKWQ